MTTIKLHPPKELPEDGVTAVAFEAWKNQVLSFLEQEIINSDFISGLYSNWHAKTNTADGLRISRVSLQDPEAVKLVAKHSKDTDGGIAKEAADKELKKKRNAQLTKCLQLVANLCQYSEQSDIMNSSTSFAWIWDHLCKHYNIETKGSHFLDISSMRPTPGQKPVVFYKQFRCGFLNNLRKKDDNILFNGTKLKEDEKLSPTFECAIMMWALEKFDNRLPSQVQKDFGFRLEGDMTLIDLQTVIFQAVPAMIEELDTSPDMRALHVEDQDDQEDPHLAAGGPHGGKGGRGGGANRFRGGRGGARGVRHPFPRGSQTSNKNSISNAGASKGCRVCRLAGKTDAVVNSHTVSKCYFFTPQDHADFANLNTAKLEQQEVDTGENSPYYDTWEED